MLLKLTRPTVSQTSPNVGILTAILKESLWT